MLNRLTRLLRKPNMEVRRVDASVARTLEYVHAELEVFNKIRHEVLMPDYVNELNPRVFDFVAQECPSENSNKQRALYFEKLSGKISRIAEDYCEKDNFVSEGIGTELRKIALNLYELKNVEGKIIF